MFHWLNWKSYSMIGVGFGLFIYVIGFFAGPQMVGFITRAERAAMAGGLGHSITRLIADPLVYGIQNPLIGAVVGGALWPFVLFWIFLLLLLMIIGVVGGGFNRLEDSVGH